ncbi:MAG: hypothetical protein WAW52_04575 [Methanothrix sp.]
MTRYIVSIFIIYCTSNVALMVILFFKLRQGTFSGFVIPDRNIVCLVAFGFA